MAEWVATGVPWRLKDVSRHSHSRHREKNEPMRPHSWQCDGIQTFHEKIQGWSIQRECLSLLAEAAVGAGKTLFGELICAAAVRHAPHILRRVIVVTPSRKDITQTWDERCKPVQAWLRDIKSSLILEIVQIDSAFDGLDIGPNDLIIVDEAHHMCRNKTWGDKVAKSGAKLFVLLSGTPFEGKLRMAFEHIEPLVTYRYVDAVRDGVINTLKLKPSNMLISVTLNNVREKHYFYDPRTQEPIILKSRPDALRYHGGANLRPEEGILLEADPEDCTDEAHQRFGNEAQGSCALLDKAVKKLRKCQHEISRDKGEAKAQGIIFAHSPEECDEIQRYLSDRWDVNSVVIHTKLGANNAKKNLDIFKKNTGGSYPWAICLNMIAEGTDIPSLCVGVYMHSYRSSLFVTQAAGRLVRKDPKAPSLRTAYLFYPQDPTLHRHLARQFPQKASEATMASQVLSDISEDRPDIVSSSNAPVAISSARGSSDADDDPSSDDEYFESQDKVAYAGVAKIVLDETARQQRLERHRQAVEETAGQQRLERRQQAVNKIFAEHPDTCARALAQFVAQVSAEEEQEAKKKEAEEREATAYQLPPLERTAKEKRLRKIIIKDIWRMVQASLWRMSGRSPKKTSRHARRSGSVAHVPKGIAPDVKWCGADLQARRKLYGIENEKMVKRCRAAFRKRGQNVPEHLAAATHLRHLKLEDLHMIIRICLPARKYKCRTGGQPEQPTFIPAAVASAMIEDGIMPPQREEDMLCMH